jgi:hypothetical protein
MIARPCNNSGPTKSVGSLVWQEFERLVEIAVAFSGTWCKMGLVSFASRCLAFMLCGVVLCYVTCVVLRCIVLRLSVVLKCGHPSFFLFCHFGTERMHGR